MELKSLEKNQEKSTSCQFVNSGFYYKQLNFYGLDISCEMKFFIFFTF